MSSEKHRHPVKLRDICSDVSYGYTASAEESVVGPKFLRITDIQGGIVSWPSVPYCQIEPHQVPKYLLVDGDIVVARTGNSTGENYLYKAQESAVFASYLIRFRVDPELADPTFIWYQLRSPSWWEFVSASKTGSAQAGANAKVLGSFEIVLPNLESQTSISRILSTLDDRIALLRETNVTLEAIAQALFKSWFVDFDPVRAKQEGRIPEGMDEATAALFPDSFEESELGSVPKGWKSRRLEEFLELAYGKALKADNRILGEIPVYGSGGITGSHNTSLTDGPSVIIGRKGTVGSLYWEDRPFFPIDTVFYVRTETPMTYCYYLLQTLGLDDMNTDAAVPGLNRKNVYRLSTSRPPDAILDAFHSIAGTMRSRIFQNSQLVQTLADLRDTLLPRLISGKIRLPEAEAELEAVAS